MTVDEQGGTFITLEGPDGAGKSSQAALLAERVRQTGREVVLTREPGGTELGERVRLVLLDALPDQHDALSDALLFNAARSRLVAEVVRPALERNEVVVCDRYADSTLAYQGYGGGLPIDLLRSLGAIATGALTPVRTVLVDVPIGVGLARREVGSASERNRFEFAEVHGADFHDRVRRGYLEMAAEDGVRWRVVDGTGDSDIVAERIWAAVADLFPG